MKTKIIILMLAFLLFACDYEERTSVNYDTIIMFLGDSRIQQLTIENYFSDSYMKYTSDTVNGLYYDVIPVIQNTLPYIYVVSIGIQDANNSTYLVDFKNDLASLIFFMLGKTSNRNIIITNVIPSRNQRTDNYNSIIESLCNEYDLQYVFCEELEYNGYLKYEYSENVLDLNSDGNRIFTDYIKEAICQ